MANLQDAFYRDQQTRYQEVEPNRFLPNRMNGDLGDTAVENALDAMASFDPYTRSSVKPFSSDAAEEILQGSWAEPADLTKCRQYTGLEGLQKLIRDVEDTPNPPVRCGWRYKRSPGGLCPEVAQGALGSKTGPTAERDPIDALGNGVNWLWDLKEAKKRMLLDVAKEAKTAEALRLLSSVCNGEYNGKLGYCLTTNKMIPILRDGRPMYPNDPLNTCAEDKIVTDPSKIPPPSANNAIAMFQQSALRELASCADTGVNPSLSRDCLLQAIKNNGCSSEGTLYTSLQAVDANQARWDSQLKNQPSFQSYQSKQGDNGFTERLFQKGMADWNQAIRQVTRLQGQAQGASDPYTRIAARDLCTSRGSFETYDFCSEISESAPIQTVELSCLQRYWQQLNGKPAGLLYPKTQTIAPSLGTVNTYGDYKAAVRKLKALTTNQDPIAQRKAFNEFYGVSVTSTAFSPDALYAGAPTPIAFWIDAMDSNSLLLDGKNGVKRWRSKTAQMRELVQNQSYLRPVYTRSGAYPGIEFSGTNQFLEIPEAASMIRNQFTIFVVERRKSSKIENYFIGGTTIFQRNQNLVLGYNSEQMGLMAFWGNDTGIQVPGYKGSTEPARLWCFKKPTGAKEVSVDGGPKVATNPNTDSLLSWAGAALGRYNDKFYQGVFYEVLIYDKALDLEAQQKVEGYLAHKWALAGNLPAGHPYKATPP